MAPRVLFVTSECAPWSKTGGLADVSASLPAALRKSGVDVRVLTPAYGPGPGVALREVASLPAMAALPKARVMEATLPSGVPAFLLDCPPLYDRRGGPYQDVDGSVWPDNDLRFAQLARAAAFFPSVEGWLPDVVHGNDWQGALVPVYQRLDSAPNVATVLTIHNLAFQGVFPAESAAKIGLPFESTLEYYGQCSFLKGGLVTAGAITTVSPTYAREIQQDELGMGLAGVLRDRSADLHGILNGIDLEEWNPATDAHLAERYDASTIDRKAANKRALEADCGWPAASGPIFGLVGRLTDQKGIDLVLAVAPAIEARGGRLVILGTGDPKLEAQVAALARSRPDFVHATIGFDEALAHRIEAGADFFLMPSRFEPCGMNQMYSQRYGTPPIVRSTGGLADSVEPYDPATGQGTGFAFGEASAEALRGAIEEAIGVHADPRAMTALQGRGMARDFGWGASAVRYREIYWEKS